MTQREKTLKVWKNIKRQLVGFQKREIYCFGICGRIPDRTPQKTFDAIFNELEYEAKRIGTYDHTYYWHIDKKGLSQRIDFVNRMIRKYSKKPRSHK